jgi:hypothetical protein
MKSLFFFQWPSLFSLSNKRPEAKENKVLVLKHKHLRNKKSLGLN